MKNKNIIMLAGGCLVGYVGTKILSAAAKKIDKIVKEQKVKKGRLIEVDGEYYKAEWI